MSPPHHVQSDDDLCGHGFNRRQSAIMNSTHWTRPRTFTPIGATNIWKPLNDSGYILDSAHFPENRERILDEKCLNLKNPDDIPDKTHSLHYYTRSTCCNTCDTCYTCRCTFDNCATRHTRYNRHTWYTHCTCSRSLSKPCHPLCDQLQTLTTTIRQQTETLTRVLTMMSTPVPATPEPPVVSMSTFMPRPGQPGSLEIFTGDNVSDYLDSFNAKCELYGVKSEHRAIWFPHYCEKDIKEIVTILLGYDTDEWKQLQGEIKRFYWEKDHPRNTPPALNALIRNSANLPLSAYLLKFTSITEALVAKGVLSATDRVIRLLAGLDDNMKLKVIKLCT